MSILKKINYMFGRKQKIQSVLLILALFLGAVLELVGVSLITELVSIISQPETITENRMLSMIYSFLGARDTRDFFLRLVICLIVVYVVKNVYLLLVYYAQYTFIYNNQLKLSGRLIDCYLKKPYTYHLDKNSAEMIRSVMLDSERFFQMLLSIFMMISELLVSALLCIYLLVVDWVITLTVVLIVGVFSALYLLIFHGRSKENGKVNQIYDGKMHQSINQALGAVKDIKILHREKYFVKAFTDCGAKKLKAVRNNDVLGQVPKLLIETVCIGAILLVLAIKLVRGEDLAQMIPQLAAFAMAAFKLLPSVSKIDNLLNLVIFLKPSVDLVYRDIKDTEDMRDKEIADSDADITQKGGDITKNGDDITQKGADITKNGDDITQKDADITQKGDGCIKIQDVSYRYPNTERDVISHVNFEIPDGVSVGFVGPSGAGKSTMADVILGILTPTGGCVSYEGRNVHEYPLWWSKKLAYIPQAIYLADESIRCNVAFGIDDDQIDDEKVWAALSEAQLAEYVKSLPEGLDTMVGERGVRLSGGQRQRIGIARALYGNPQILVLDEATSALDNETESAVMEAIDRLAGRKTLIIIAHRLTTIQNCDVVFKVENGAIARWEK